MHDTPNAGFKPGVRGVSHERHRREQQRPGRHRRCLLPRAHV